jgi:hypothetical protein
MRGLRVRIARFLALAAAVSLNHELGRDSRALVDYVAWSWNYSSSDLSR